MRGHVRCLTQRMSNDNDKVDVTKLVCEMLNVFGEIEHGPGCSIWTSDGQCDCMLPELLNKMRKWIQDQVCEK